jgi:hypothetical protein
MGCWGVESEKVQDNGQGRPEAVPSLSGEDPLDQTGQEILELLQRAAGIAEKNSQQALGIAHKLSLELRSAEDHIKKLEAEVRYYKDRSGRAEEWLRQISAQIELHFPAPVEHGSNKDPERQKGPEVYAPKKSDRRRT